MMNEVLLSLRQESKSIASKYFYDNRGNELFQEITQLEEYYLTRCEKEILSTYSSDILKDFENQQVDLLEIGPGNGEKALIVLRDLVLRKKKFSFYAVDICEEALLELKERFRRLRCGVEPTLIVGDFCDSKNLISNSTSQPKLVMFLGSSIGNMTRPQSSEYLSELAANLSSDDRLLVGFDLKKDPQVLLEAYNDKKGVTAEFNLNLLARLNRELKADFDLSEFYHHEIYDQDLGAMVSYLVSRKDQMVQMSGQSVFFRKDEFIHTEYSFKYDQNDIARMAESSGLKIQQMYFDKKKYFCCALFRKSSS